MSGAPRPAATGTRTGTLWIVATPIGNLEDVSARALRVLREAALIACEDTRTTRKLLARHGIEARLVACHEHNEARKSAEIVAALLRGEDVALATDAGTPAVSDPGRRVVEAARAAGAPVVPVPGPSAVTAALAASGIDARCFAFFGFPPRKAGARRAFLEAALAFPGAALFFEAPHRIVATLEALAALAPARPASLHREMTKVHEELRGGTLAELAAAIREKPPRGEYTLVVAGVGEAPRPAPGAGLAEAVAEARGLVAGGRSARDAAREVAARRRVSRRAVYQELRGKGEEEE